LVGLKAGITGEGLNFESCRRGRIQMSGHIRVKKSTAINRLLSTSSGEWWR